MKIFFNLNTACEIQENQVDSFLEEGIPVGCIRHEANGTWIYAQDPNGENLCKSLMTSPPDIIADEAEIGACMIEQHYSEMLPTKTPWGNKK